MQQKVLEGNNWSQIHQQGFDSLVCEAIKNKAEATKNEYSCFAKKSELHRSCGILWNKNDKNGRISVTYYPEYVPSPTIPRILGKFDHLCNEYAFCAKKCSFVLDSGSKDGIVCFHCGKAVKKFRKKCFRRGEFDMKG